MSDNDKEEFLYYCKQLDDKTLEEVIKLLEISFDKKDNLLDCDNEKQLQYAKGYLNCIIEIKRTLNNFVNVKNGIM